MDFYKVKVYDGRFLKWCDDIWFETTKKEPQLFTLDEAKRKVKLLRKHYIYNAKIVTSTDEEVENMGNNPESEQEQPKWYNVSLSMIKTWKKKRI